MSVTYVDASALRHLLIEHDVLTPMVQGIVAQTAVESVVMTSQLAITELHRAAQAESAVQVAEVRAALALLDMVPITAALLEAAGLLPNPRGAKALRSLDAIHAQSAIEVGATSFVTSDEGQALAARSLGLDVLYLKQ